MRKRTKARECSLKILYAIDITGGAPDYCMNDFFSSQGILNEDVKKFSEFIIDGVVSKKETIDGMITKYATNWQLDRMATIDRNVLRMACFELLYADDIPSKVTINEAIELAKKYGDKDSGKFVNGVIDKINKQEAGKKVSRKEPS